MQTQTFKNRILNDFVATLACDNSSSGIKQSLAIKLINELGGEDGFLKLHSKIATGSFNDATTELTENKVVNFYIKNQDEVSQGMMRCMENNPRDYQEVFYERLCGLLESEVSYAMKNKASLLDKKTDGLKGLAWAVVEICITDLSISFYDYQNQLFQSTMIS